MSTGVSVSSLFWCNTTMITVATLEGRLVWLKNRSELRAGGKRFFLNLKASTKRYLAKHCFCSLIFIFCNNWIKKREESWRHRFYYCQIPFVSFSTASSPLSFNWIKKNQNFNWHIFFLKNKFIYKLFSDKVSEIKLTPYWFNTLYIAVPFFIRAI